MNSITLQIRLRLLQHLFKFSGFENIRGHWVCTKILHSKSNIIDVGANRGDFTKIIMEKIGGFCYIVEPNKSLFDGINIKGVKKINCAVTLIDGPIKFYLSKNNEASSILENFQNRWENDHIIEVDGVCWKTVISKFEFSADTIIDVLKIDIEGGELDLIEQFDSLDLCKINQITVEFHDWLNKDLHSRTVAVINKLINFGYVSYCSSPNHNWPTEILFIKRSLMRKSCIQKIFLSIAKQISFLKYN